ncbi:MAG TPA: hypothetical protein VLU25_20960 [Acidobacteriota bacterium]|nr:hypothetical protein [Acidobacteriota bacterium]
MSNVWKVWGRAAGNAEFLDQVQADARGAAESLELRLSQYDVGEISRLLGVQEVYDALANIGQRIAALASPAQQGEDCRELVGILTIDRGLRNRMRQEGVANLASQQFLHLNATEVALIEDLLNDPSASQSMEDVTEEGWFTSCSLALLDDPAYNHDDYTPQEGG